MKAMTSALLMDAGFASFGFSPRMGERKYSPDDARCTNLLGETHLGRRELETVVGFRHLLRDLQSEIARYFEMLDDGGFDVDFREGSTGERRRERDYNRKFPHIHLRICIVAA